jgi:hypothetical protein
MVLFLKSFSIFVINKDVRSLQVTQQWCLLPRSTHFDLGIFCKAFKGLKPFLAAYTFFCFLWACPTFLSKDLCTLVINYIVRIIWSTMTLGLAYSSNTSHKPLRLLSMVNIGRQPVSTMKGEYFVLAWMPHWYPKNIRDTSESQSYMLIAAITMSPCLMVFVKRLTMPLHWGQAGAVNWCMMP